MPRIGQKPPKIEAAQLCHGCVYLVHKLGSGDPGNYKCVASGKSTFPTRTACSLWRPRS